MRETEGVPLSSRALPSEVWAVGLVAAVGVPPAGVVIGVGDVFTVGVMVGEGCTVAVTVGFAGVGERFGVTVTGG